MKRFTGTEKWSDPWFRKLPPHLKLLWFYVCENCDCAGVWKVDEELASFVIGAEINLDEALGAYGDRVKMLGAGKLFICRFVGFQYGLLSEDCRPHKQVIQTLMSHGIPPDWLPDQKGYQIPYSKGIHTLKDKDKDKDKEEGGVGETVSPSRFKAPQLGEVTAHGVTIGLPAEECTGFWHYFESNGWRVGRNPMKCWKSAMITWRTNWKKRNGHSTDRNPGAMGRPDRSIGTTNEGKAAQYRGVGKVVQV